MADFALWASACETRFRPEGSFEAAYAHNLDHAVENVLEADPVGEAIRALMAGREQWEGTASMLLVVLEDAVGESVCKAKGWPRTPRALSGRLRRLATFLRKAGTAIAFERTGRDRTRTIRITSRLTNRRENGGGICVRTVCAAGGSGKVRDHPEAFA